MAHEAGKGGASRPFSVTADEYDRNHARIFGERKRERWIPPPLPGCPAKPPETSQEPSDGKS